MALSVNGFQCDVTSTNSGSTNEPERRLEREPLAEQPEAEQEEGYIQRPLRISRRKARPVIHEYRNSQTPPAAIPSGTRKTLKLTAIRKRPASRYTTLSRASASASKTRDFRVRIRSAELSCFAAASNRSFPLLLLLLPFYPDD